MNAPFVVTTETLIGYDILRTVAFVSGSHVVPLSPFHNGVKSIATGKTYPMDRLLEIVTHARFQAVTACLREARYQGGNAVVAARFDERPLTPAWLEITCYGTAVVVRPSAEPIGSPGSLHTT